MGSVSNMEALEELQKIENLENVNPGLIRSYLDTIPEKMLNLGVRVLITLILIAIGIYITRLLRRLVRRGMERAKADKGAIQFVDSCLKVALYGILIMMIATRVGVDATSIVALVGSMGLTLGLALQGSLANFAGGVLLLTMKPFKVGDYIIEDTYKNEGYVTNIQIFYTTIHTIDNRVVTIPNGTLANTSLTNVTGMKDRRLDLSFSISYHADLRKAKDILRQVLDADENINQKTKPEIFVDALDDSAVKLGIHAWVKTELYFSEKWKITENVKLAFDENGIEIPFPQMDIHMKEK